jgi:hypothetical protein
MAPSAAPGADHEVPLWRLHLIRAFCLFFVIAAPFNDLPRLFFHAPDERGMITCILAGLWVMALIGLRYPLKMMPIFLFECAWKTIWTIFFGLPQWLSGVGSPRLGQDLFDIGFFAIVFGLLIPWGHVWRHYVREPAERWR